MFSVRGSAAQTPVVARRRAIDRLRDTRAAVPHLPPAQGLLPLAILLIVWQLKQRGVDPYYPAPSRWWSAIVTAWKAGAVEPAIVATCKTFVIGLVLATILGTVLGAAVGRSPFLDRALGPIFEFFRVLPAAAVVPIIVLFSGYTERMKLAVVLFTGVWPILLQVRTTARMVNPVTLEMAHMLRLGRARTLAKVLVPALVPGIVAGLRIAAPILLIVTLLAEALTQVNGIGSLLLDAQRNYNSAEVYGLVIFTGILALTVNWLVEVMAAVLRRYDNAA
jgi:ABC-type nitrate/sulfonate/bicarbonate transport system permease component